jgi:hypothetical protein
MKAANLRRVAALYVSGVLILHLLVVWRVREVIWKGYPDFTIYYTAGSMLRQGMGHELYDEAAQSHIQREFAPQFAPLTALPFNYHLPFEAVLFVPLTYFSYHAAFALWTLANLAMLATLPRLIRPYVPLLNRRSAAEWTIASLAFFPIFFSLLQGQDAILLLFLYALAFISLKKERFVCAGGWLAFGLFKFHLVLPFLFLLLIQLQGLHRRKRVFCGFLGVALMQGLVSIAAVGTQQMIAYPRYVLGLEETIVRQAIVPADMPNLRGVLYLIAAKYRNFDSMVMFLSVVLFVWAAWTLSRKEEGTSGRGLWNLKFSLAVLTTVLVSYHALGYDLCIVVLPVLLLADELQNKIDFSLWTRATICAGLALLLFSPLQLILLVRYNRLALLGWAPLLCFLGLAGAPRSRLGLP